LGILLYFVKFVTARFTVITVSGIRGSRGSLRVRHAVYGQQIWFGLVLVNQND